MPLRSSRIRLRLSSGRANSLTTVAILVAVICLLPSLRRTSGRRKNTATRYFLPDWRRSACANRQRAAATPWRTGCDGTSTSRCMPAAQAKTSAESRRCSPTRLQMPGKAPWDALQGGGLRRRWGPGPSRRASRDWMRRQNHESGGVGVLSRRARVQRRCRQRLVRRPKRDAPGPHNF